MTTHFTITSQRGIQLHFTLFNRKKHSVWYLYHQRHVQTSFKDIKNLFPITPFWDIITQYSPTKYLCCNYFRQQEGKHFFFVLLISYKSHKRIK